MVADAVDCELALMRAMGVRRRTLGGLVTLESSLLLIAGLLAVRAALATPLLASLRGD